MTSGSKTLLFLLSLSLPCWANAQDPEARAAGSSAPEAQALISSLARPAPARTPFAEARFMNPDIEIQLHDCRFSSENAERIVAGYDVIVDGSDNFATRYLSNDVCVFAAKPNVYGSVFRFEGQTTVFAPQLGGPCEADLASAISLTAIRSTAIPRSSWSRAGCR